MPEFERSGGNVFADIGFSEEESKELLAKARLTAIIKASLEKAHLTQAKAAKAIGITQPRLSRLLRGDFKDISEAKLIDCLNRLGYNVKIVITPHKQAKGSRAIGNLEVVEV